MGAVGKCIKLIALQKELWDLFLKERKKLAMANHSRRDR